jgi:hypothetical protein
MFFEKPLKVFLSYSRQDAPELFLQFRAQLKSLEDDRLIRVWADRDISAGADWDQVIQARLRECDIFLALTSASFNSSNYITGIEVKTAFERQQQGVCRVLGIMWRSWRPPEKWRKAQFLTDLDTDVVNAKNPDEVMKRLIGAVEDVVDEMSEGRWEPDSATADRLPNELAYLCDWTMPIQQLSGLQLPAKSVRRPAVLVLIGTNDDCADGFLQRTLRANLPQALNVDGIPVHDIRPLDWPPDPDSASGFVHLALEARRDLDIEKKLPEGLTVLRTVTTGWSSGKSAVLRQILEEWTGEGWCLPANRALLFVISIENSPWLSAHLSGSVRKRIAEICRQVSTIPAVIITLPKIEREHALNWPVLPAVQAYHLNRQDQLKDDIRRLYWWRRRLAMRRLVPSLLRILQKHRVQRNAA